MTDWTAGYVADIGYTYGYYPELNPLRVKLAFLSSGLVAPDIGNACELGFGQGMSANLHAAASLVSWHGTDFNPSQAGFAQELAVASGAGAQLHDDAFSDFCNRPDLPDFDYIGLHGIWSWISDTNRAVIVDFIRRKLKVGGVVYISYNTLPGWSTFAPMRHLLTQHASNLGAEGAGIVNRIDSALSFTDKLLATKPLYSRANPSVSERMDKLKAHNRNYLAHEYFNADWHPMYFADLAKWLTPAKLSFACSTHFLDHVSQINFTGEQQAILNDIADPEFKETVRDYMVNQQFRRDYWVKGARKLSILEQTEALRQLRVVLTTPRADVQLKFSTALGDATMSEGVYAPILDFMADHKVKTIAQLEQLAKNHGTNFSQLTQALLILVGTEHVQLAQEEQVANKARRSADKLNAYLITKARGNTDIGYLASPVIAGAVTIDRFSQLFLLSRSQGGKQPAEWAQFTWGILASQNQRIIKEGKQLETAEENLAELNVQAQAFADKKLPILKALMVA
jgi:SAM-dependent methyltransferase